MSLTTKKEKYLKKMQEFKGTSQVHNVVVFLFTVCWFCKFFGGKTTFILL